MEIKECHAVLGKQLFIDEWILSLICRCLILLLISTFLTACESAKDSQHPVMKNSDLQEIHSFQTFKQSEKDAGKIEAIYGWLSSDTILYSVKLNGAEQPQLKTWNWKTDKRTLFYQPSAPIKMVSISPSNSYVMVLTTSKNKIQSNIVSVNGDSVYSVALPAYEITYEWNPYNDGVLFMSTFSEDWSYDSYVVDAANQTTKMIDFPQPFAQWDSKNGLMYLDWDKEKATMSAPLVRKELSGGTVESIMLNIVHFDKMLHTLLTIQEETESPNWAAYSFYNNKNQLITSFSLPNFKSFSGMGIPAYDVNEEKENFFTFTPEKSLNETKNKELYSLIQFNWKTGQRKKILTHALNEPISCSSNGGLCLYGYSFEKIIDVHNHKIIQIFEAKP